MMYKHQFTNRIWHIKWDKKKRGRNRCIKHRRNIILKFLLSIMPFSSLVQEVTNITKK